MLNLTKAQVDAAIARGKGIEPRQDATVVPKSAKINAVLPYPPSLNSLYATFRGRRILSAKGRAYKKTVADCTYGLGFITGPVTVSVAVYRPRKSGDLDNTLKALLDSLTGILYTDDREIVRIVAERFDDAGNPRAVVTVTSVHIEKEANGAMA